MSKAIKLTNGLYLDSTGIVHNQVLLSNILNMSVSEMNLDLYNGYVKYENGFMFQWKFTSASVSPTLWTGSIYYADVNMGNWSVPFTNLLGELSSVGSQQWWSTIGDFNNTSAGIVRVFRPTQVSQTIYLRVFAYGLWK